MSQYVCLCIILKNIIKKNYIQINIITKPVK